VHRYALKLPLLVVLNRNEKPSLHSGVFVPRPAAA